MSEVEGLRAWFAVPVAFLLVLGGLISVIGAFGLLRLPNFYQRIHAPAITITLGTGCILMASMIYFSVLLQQPVLHEITITLFLFMTAPVVSMLIMRAAVYRDLRLGRRESGIGAGDIYRFPAAAAETEVDKAAR